MHHIYGLCDPHNHSLRYVGVTNNPSRREREHLVHKTKGKCYLSNWKRSLGRPPIFVLLASGAVNMEEASTWEKEWIKTAKGAGLRLVNYSDGGYGGVHTTLERPASWREAISRGKLGRPRAPHSRESIEKVAAWHRGKKRSADARARMSAAQKANKVSLARLVERNKTMKFEYSPERRRRMSEIMKKLRADRPNWKSR